MNRIVICFVVTLLVVGVAFAGGLDKKSQVKRLAIDEGTPTTPSTTSEPPMLESAAINWIVIDSMANAYGMLSNRVKPHSYDPITGALAFIHRGSPPWGTSGQLWYNTSVDGGAAWRRIPGTLNVGVPAASRYPSATLYNPLASPDTVNLLFSYSAPQLVAGGWGGVVYGVDVFGTNNPYTILDIEDTTFWSNTTIWPASNWVMWTSRRDAPNNDYYLWRTQDYSAIPEGVPTTWTAANFADNGLDIGGKYRNGASYFGVWAVFSGDPDTVWNVGYSKSTNNGVTWSSWIRPQPDWRSVPGIAGTIYDDWWSYEPPPDVGYSKDMLVDAQGYVHFFGVAYDTLTNTRGLIEVYETASGWAGKIVKADMARTAYLTYGYTLNQMGHHLNAAISADGSVMAISWLEAGAVGDTLTDIWFSFRHISSATWSTPANLTETPALAEMLLQAAPVLRWNGGNSYTMFFMRAYQTGTNAWPPNDLAITGCFFGTHTFTITGVDERIGLPDNYRLSQNFPNPFNPATKIQYSVPKEEFVTLKVYNTMGQEVKTLVNDVRQPGTYEVVFDATNLPSGVYFYKLSAGNYLSTKKMVLLK